MAYTESNVGLKEKENSIRIYIQIISKGTKVVRKILRTAKDDVIVGVRWCYSGC